VYFRQIRIKTLEEIMTIVKDQTGLAVLLGVAKSTITWWLARGLPHRRKGFAFYFDTNDVSEWLREEGRRRYAHLIKILDNYKG